MLTRSKQRALAAESAEGQKGHEGSSLGMKLPADWTELPVELLMMIFDNLTTQRSSYYERRKSLLSCRLVNHQWKSAMDDLLEKRSLSFWKKWKQPQFNSYKFPVVRFNSSGKNILENVTFPFFLQGNVESCPFPTNSVCLTSTLTSKGKDSLAPRLMGEAHFFSKYGHHLTSLTIEDVSGRKDFTAQTLRDLLFYTPHLKAMALQLISIKLLKKDFGKISLPPLPHLEHVRLERIYSRGFQFNARKWILEPYHEQLISVKCAWELGWKNPLVNFPMLKQLQLHYPTTQQLLAPVAFPSLKSLDLRLIKLYEKGRGEVTLEHVFKFICVMASTLVELNLDIVKYRRSKTNPIDYEKDLSLQELQKIQQSRFPVLKTLSISYPKYEEEVKVVKDFLKMFPNLETLNFTRFEEYPKNPDSMELHRTTVREHLNKEKYQGLCPKLRTINVYMEMGNGERPFFTSQFPFST